MEFEGLNPEIVEEETQEEFQATIIEGNTIRELNENYINLMMKPYQEKILCDEACMNKYGMSNDDRYRQLYDELQSRVYLNEYINEENISTNYNSDYVNRVHNTSFIDKLNDLPYFTPIDMSELGVYSKAETNYYGEPSNIEYNDIEWYKDYQLLSLGVLPENYEESAKRRLNKLESLSRKLQESEYKDNSIKQSMLELGWNPEIVYCPESRIKITENTKNKLTSLLPQWEVYDATNISDTIIQEAKTKNKNPVYIILVYTASTFGKLIKQYTHGIYTHAAIAVDHTLEKLYSYNLANNFNLLGGFSIESISGYLRDNKDAIMCVYTTFIDDVKKHKLQKQLDYYINNVDKTKYSFLNIFSLLANKPVELANDMICSQFVDRMLKSIDLDITGRSSSLVTPNDLYRTGQGKIYKLFEGRVDQYDHKKARNKVNKLMRSNITEAKSTPVQFDNDGNLLIIKNISDIEEEYNKSHKLLMNYDKTNNYEAMKYELYKLWYLNLILERKIYTKRKKDKDLLDMRAKILNDFNKYLKKVNRNDPNYIFSDGYEQSQYNDSIYKIHNNTLKYGIKYAKQMIGLFENTNIIHEKIMSSYNSNLMNAEDLQDHSGVSCIIFNDDYTKILVLDHVKFDMITIPCGKVDPGEDLYTALIREVKEETNLNILNAEWMYYFVRDELRNGIRVREINHMFVVTDYNGKPNNNEPNKHRDLFWMDLNDFMKIKTRSYGIQSFRNCINADIIDIYPDERRIEINATKKKYKLGGDTYIFEKDYM